MEVLGTPAGSDEVKTGNPEGEVTTNPEGSTTPETTLAPADWRNGFSDELKGNKGLEKFKDPAALAQSYLHLEKKIGEKGILPLKEDATQEEKDAYYNALGRPEKPEGYEIAYPDGMPEGMRDDALLADFRAKAHELGLSKAQAETLAKWQIEHSMTQGQTLQGQWKAENEAAETALKTEWGAKYDENLKGAKNALTVFSKDDPKFIEYLEKTGLGSNPSMVRIFHRINEGMAEDSKLKQGDHTNVGDSFEAQRDTIMNSEAFSNPTHKDYESTQKKLAALYAKQYPEDKK